MNILFITARSDMGGGPKHLLDLAGYFRKHKEINISIAAPDEKPFAKAFLELSDHFLELPKRKFTPWHYWKLLRHCRQHDIKLVHSHGRGAGVYGRLLSLFGIKCIHTFHGIHIERTFIGKLKLLLDSWLHHLTSHYICVSNGEKLKFEELGFRQDISLEVIENGVDVSKIKSEFTQKRKSNSQFTLGTLARLHYQKGIDLLIESIKQNKQFFDENNLKVLVAGNGPEYEKYQRMIEQYDLCKIIELTGETNDPVGFLAGLDVYISFARWEGLPLSVLEAKACGLPTLLSDSVGHHEFPPLFRNSNEFLETIKDWMEHIPPPESLDERFTLATMAEKTWRLYQ